MQVYFSYSEDGLHWKDLNGGLPVLCTELGEKGVRDPFLVRSPVWRGCFGRVVAQQHQNLVLIDVNAFILVSLAEQLGVDVFDAVFQEAAIDRFESGAEVGKLVDSE